MRIVGEGEFLLLHVAVKETAEEAGKDGALWNTVLLTEEAATDLWREQ